MNILSFGPSRITFVLTYVAHVRQKKWQGESVHLLDVSVKSVKHAVVASEVSHCFLLC
jgi:hypothetical protein